MESRKTIKSRLIEEIAREWDRRGIDDLDLEQFDPVVNLLIEACSFELEKLYHETDNSRERIFERLVAILTPDAMTGAKPAHAIMHGRSNEPEDEIDPYHLYFTKPEGLQKDIFFSPAGKFKVFNASINYLVFDDKVMAYNAQLEGERISGTLNSFFAPATLYIGLKMDPKISSLAGFSFFFNWKNEPRIDSFLSLLPLTNWSMNGRSLKMAYGLQPLNDDQAKPSDILAYLGEHHQIESRVRDIYDRHFCTIEEERSFSAWDLNPYPAEFAEILDEQVLRVFREPLLWIKVAFPAKIGDGLKNVQCLPNCVPAINRRLHDRSEQVKGQVNMLTLDLDGDHFLAMDELNDSDHRRFQSIPLHYSLNNDQGTYALRKSGVQRFDRRDAKKMLGYVLDLTADEATAFNAMRYDSFSSDLKALEVGMEKMTRNLKTDGPEGADMFIFLKPFKDSDKVFQIRYWTTNGATANGTGRAALNPYKNSSLQTGSLFLLTSPRGGRGPLDAAACMHAFKEAVMTRGRIVTPEDIRSFCINQIGAGNIQDVAVSKGVEKATAYGHGLARTTKVVISFRGVSDYVVWEERCREIAVLLNKYSTGLNAITVQPSFA